MLDRVSVLGSYFGQNFGDTLLIRTAIEAARAAGARHINCPLADEEDLELLGADSVGVAPMAQSSALVFTGGGYFAESPRRPWVWSIRHLMRYGKMARHAKARGIPYGLFGVEVGPLSVPLTRWSTAWIFNNAAACTVRTRASLDYLRSLGVKREVRVGIDSVAFADSASFTDQELGDKPSTPHLAIHVSSEPDDTENAMLDGAVAAIEAASVKPRLTVFSDHFQNNRQAPFARSVTERAERVHGKIVDYDGSPDGLIRLLSNQHMTVTSRLHTGITAAALGGAVTACPFHSKTRRFYEEIGETESLVPPDAPCAEFVERRVSAWLAGEVEPIQLNLPGEDIHRTQLAAFLGEVAKEQASG